MWPLADVTPGGRQRRPTCVDRRVVDLAARNYDWDYGYGKRVAVAFVPAAQTWPFESE